VATGDNPQAALDSAAQPGALGVGHPPAGCRPGSLAEPPLQGHRLGGPHMLQAPAPWLPETRFVELGARSPASW